MCCCCCCTRSSTAHPISVVLTHHDAGVELVEALHGAIAEAVAQVFLDKVGVVEDVVGHQGLLSSVCRVRKGELKRKKKNTSETEAGLVGMSLTSGDPGVFVLLPCA